MSNNNIDLKELWGKQETTIPDTKELFEKTKKFKKNNLRKLIIANILLLLTSAFIVFIWYYYQPEMITTKIGIVLTILAMVLYLFVYNQMIPLLVKVDYDINSSQYLQQLLKFKEKQLFLQNTMLNIYFILLSTGICMYMFEYASRMTLLWATFSYGLTLLWIAVNWFYFRPRIIKKQQTKINELISNFEGLNRQLTDE
ncbi:MAG: hypothetical protein ACYCVH_15330 [Ignavibacteriaceae bacterium]